MKLEKLGWVAAVGLAGLMFGAGFQTKADKVGVVDLAKAYGDSELAARQRASWRQQYQHRQGVLEFMQTYPVLTSEQANRLRELSIKEVPTAAETQELNKLKDDVKKADQTYKSLQTKSSPTPAEVTQLQDFTNRGRALNGLMQRWAGEFENEMQAVEQKSRREAFDRAREAVREVGAKQGFTIIYSQDAAAFGANDITADVLKAMNAKK